MILYETTRTIVRHLEAGDLDDFAALTGDPAVIRYMGDGETLSRAMTERWILVSQANYTHKGYGCSAVIDRATGRMFGWCGIIYAPGSDLPEIIYAFAPDTWGKGYASEIVPPMLDYGFRVHGLPRIYATIHPDNAPSRRVAEKIGMRFDGLRIDEQDGLPSAWYVAEPGTNV